ncbi:GtrA family protein, partial [Clostridiaceae bacterium OttesenSCG-928-D20]|nr:GtrA family protein [Clostridiaceae bacterium OttesenSCG-928-D20]
MIKKLFENEKLRKFIKFACIGVLNTLVDYLSFSFLYYVVHLSKYLAQFLAVCIAATNSYGLNNNFTFKATKQKGVKPYLKFMSVNLISVGMSLVLMYVFSDLLKLEPILAKIPISLLMMFVSFTAYDKIVFS